MNKLLITSCLVALSVFTTFRVLASNKEVICSSFIIINEVSNDADSALVIKKLIQAEKLIHHDDKQAFQLTKEALDLAHASKHPELIGKVQNALGNLYWFNSDYNKASTAYFQALESYQKTGNQFQIAVCYRNIGWIYLGQEKFDLCEKYFLKSLELIEKLNRPKEILISYDDLAIFCLESGAYNKGLEYCKTSLRIAQEINDTESKGTTLMTKGNLLFKLKNYSDAKDAFLESIHLLKPISRGSYNLCLAHLGLARVYLTTKNARLAESNTKQAIELAKEGQLTKELADAYSLLADIYYQEGNSIEAFNFVKQYAEVKDTLNARNNRQFIQGMAADFEMKQNELRIQNLEQKEKLAQTQLGQERAFKIFLVVIVLLSTILGLIAFRSFLRKKKDNQKLSLAYAEIEAKNKDISDSMSYALNIQQARLPHDESLKKDFKGCFVVYLPRDIVSGDFYWHNHNDDGKHVFAIADCTGHGIPGAFMSMMGIDGFNYAILEKRIERPKEILKLVNHFIKDSLRQKQNQARSKDGMDVALCTLTEDKKKLYFSGANRPIWIYRNGEILEFKPDKISIGGNHLDDYDFSEHEIDLEENDTIYLFSDGYADQFGGERSKKFMTKQLKELIRKLGHEDMVNQESKIIDAFNLWKGDLTQVDDVVVMGIRI